MITEDFHFELLPSIGAVEGHPFGIGLPIGLDEDGFVPGSTDWAVQDSENSQNGATGFGRDRLLGPTWSWQLHVNEQDTASALAAMRGFKRAWNALQIRETPGAVLPLRYQLEGEKRRIYGRPRRFEAPPDNRILGGYVPISVDFKCVDGFVYSDEEQDVAMYLGKGVDDEGIDSGGGMTFPVTWPVIGLPPTRRQAAIIVKGDSGAYPIIRFEGPVANPGFITNGWRIDIAYNLPEGQYIEIDTRPWVNTVMLNGNASVAGLMGHRQRLAKMRLPLGQFQGRFVGSGDGTAICRVRWATTYESW